MSENQVFQYYPFKSCVDPSFWYKLSELKIDEIKLSEESLNIFGYYSNFNTKNCLNFVDFSSFNSDFTVPVGSFKSHGILINKNTIEDFKNCNKNDILEKAGQTFWENIRNGRAVQDPSLLSSFLVLSFADLKNHHFYFWFAFPACNQPVLQKLTDPVKIESVMTPEQLSALDREYFARKLNTGYFIVETSGSKLEIKDLNQRISAEAKDSNFQNIDLENTFFCFADPCEYENAGWVLRNFISFLVFLCPRLRSQTIKVVSLRVIKGSVAQKSLVHDIKLPVDDVDESTLKWVGWERNEQGNFGPKVAKLGDSMDPLKMASNSINLNLKLMKWRLLPDLDLEKIANTKCLLVGAGTLGCGVARSLMAWGCNHITFIDSGTVSLSNPVRQYLYTHKDAVEKRPKAKAAEEHVQEIHPGITTKGHIFDIPMPGHPIGESMRVITKDNIGKLINLINEHDTIFLLTDSRESRWLPTLLGAVHKKTVITAALGFDSYLVMRHGSRLSSAVAQTTEIDGLKCISGNELGCYFCNDITAPGNSMKDRTLDQQCTVTRPAVSNIAASLAVELMVSLLQHKDKQLAPAYQQRTSKDTTSIPEGLMGIIPHSIRGSLSTFEQILPATERFMQCIACSVKVSDEYLDRGLEFLMEVFNSSAKFLEDLTGITEMMKESDALMVDFDDDFDCSD